MASLLERLSPALVSERTIEWPGPVPAGMDRPQLRVRVLSGPECEAAYLAAKAHFRRQKVQLAVTDPAFIVRERAEKVWRAFSDTADAPLARDTDQLEELLAPELRDVLFMEWLSHQNDHVAAPRTAAELDALVEGLKKNIPEEVLLGWPTSLLVRLLRITASQLSSSTTDA